MRTFWTFCGRPKILWCEFDNWYIINMETQDDCFNCQTMRQQIEQLKQKHLLDFKTIKQKIISTDELIKLYQKKCQEFDKQATYITELTGKLEGSQRNLDVIKLQLEKSIELNEPLKKKCDELEKEKQNGTVEVQKLNDRLKGSENLIKQLKTVIKEKEKSEEASRLDVSIQNQEIESQKKK